MKIIKTATFLLFCLAVYSPTAATAQDNSVVKYNSVIKGRVVDEEGKPMARTSVSFSFAEGGSEDRVCGKDTMGVMTDANGKFVIKEYCTDPKRSIFLYLIPPTPDNAETLLDPPFGALRNKELRFLGKQIFIEKNESIDLGDIQPDVRYGSVELFLLDKKGKPYFKKPDDWESLILFLRDQFGDFVYGIGLNAEDITKKVNKEKGSIRIAIPEGKWTIQLLTNWDDYDDETDEIKRMLASTKLNIKRTDSFAPIHITIK